LQCAAVRSEDNVPRDQKPAANMIAKILQQDRVGEAIFHGLQIIEYLLPHRHREGRAVLDCDHGPVDLAGVRPVLRSRTAILQVLATAAEK
jgi:hypothetical protein